ncbi:hypothetical protein [Deinococcus yavapaiensis]|uniref:Uncharacterized protein n=1 Tax=Deinococcus yavapaiensis KR-236 TaxID=694435 RepID=A0A318SMU1_9DEIO|nr:hypothetical protein [Deinococcus yavapaiensis]PYE53871.1 hypothetical protein DES52_107129 [Deinococcus yavapaiensis KR-236]
MHTNHQPQVLPPSSGSTKAPDIVRSAAPRAWSFDAARRSALVWVALMAYWALADVLTPLFPSGGRSVHPDSWLTHTVITLLGLAAVWCMHHTGFPSGWDRRNHRAGWLAWPAFTGVALGALQVGTEVVTNASEVLAARLGQAFNVAFPQSFWVYTGGAITWEFVFLLFPVPVLLWLISRVVLRGRAQEVVFWTLAVMSACLEPLMQGSRMVSVADGALSPGVFVAYAVQAFALNFSAAAFFRRYGLLAPVVVRLSYYLVWHVIYGNFFG